MFGRKKKTNALVNQMDDTKCVVYDFRRRLLEFESYRPAEYKMPSEMDDSAVIPKLDAYLNNLFAWKIDEFNENVLDNLIFATAREGQPKLALQRFEHRDMISRLSARFVSDDEDLKMLRDLRKEELKKLKRDYETTCYMMDMDLGKEVPDNEKK